MRMAAVAGSSALAAGAEKRRAGVILDTDIGGDIDDALALIYLLNSPEIDLRGVTTVKGNTHRRAQFATMILAAMGRGEEIACHAGCTLSMTPRRAGQDPRGLRGYAGRAERQNMGRAGDDGTLEEENRPPVSPEHAVDYIVRATREQEGPRRLLVVGPETNAGMALVKDPGLADRLEGITLMGYNFETGVDPYNIGGDLTAARHVLDSGIPLRVLPIEIGVACQMTEADYQSCLASSAPQMQLIREPMRRWVDYVRQRPGAPVPGYCPRPYDSLAAMTLTHPELFEWKRGTIELTLKEDPSERNTAFREHASGIHEIVTGVDREKAMALHQERLLRNSG